MSDCSSTLFAVAGGQTLSFLLVLTRLAPSAAVAPLWGSRRVPARVRVALAVVLALMVTSLHTSSPAVVRDGSELGLLLGREVFLGLALALAARVLFVGVQLAGQLIGQLSGMALAEVVDPQAGQATPLLAEFLNVVAVMVFVLSGGHRQVMRALLDSFRWRPPGQFDLPDSLFRTAVDVWSESFVVALRVAAPVVLALLVAMAVLGLIQRTLPQLNLFSVGLSLNALVMLSTLIVALGAIAWLVEQESLAMFDSIEASVVEANLEIPTGQGGGPARAADARVPVTR